MRVHHAILLALVPAPLLAQTWNGEDAITLVARAIGRRALMQADSTLRDYRARAHGFVFFLGQLGEGLAEPPRLIKSDELTLEVYWKAPGLSKQRIVGWRDRVDLPTDIRYHRDHLGIVQNNFGDRIRLGHGDEVRGVRHPLSRDGPSWYNYALVDSQRVRLAQGEVRVYEVLVRPKVPNAVGVVGSLYIDVETSELVLFRFNFTRSAYLDRSLEDITIVLENSFWNGRYWLPRRQEIEIRRRTRWLDLPARGIIRGRWEIEDYALNVGLPDTLFPGPEIVVASPELRDTFSWRVPLDAAIREAAGPAVTFDLESVRDQIGHLAGPHLLSGLPASRPGARSISDFLHFNRVEGLAPGVGWVVRPGGGPAEIRGWVSYGVSDQRLKARLSGQYPIGRFIVALSGAREVIDIADEPVIAPILNSILGQELGRDYGDYVLRERAEATIRREFGPRGRASLAAGVERTTSVAIATTPVSGTFRENPALGTGTLALARLCLERRNAQLALARGASGRVQLEAGKGEGIDYVRLRTAARLHTAVGPTELVARAWAGWGSWDLPPHRSFVLGGRGTLVSEPFRAWGGRYAAHGTVEWRFAVPFPAVPVGPFASTGRQIVLAPFVSAGWAGGAIAAVPWRPSDGVRPVVGVGLEWFHRLLRADLGVGLRDPSVALVVDIRRDLWGIL